MIVKTLVLCLFALFAVSAIGGASACDMFSDGVGGALTGVYAGGSMRMYTFAGVTEGACAYDNTTNSVGGDSRNCFYFGSGYQNSVCRARSELTGVATNVYACVPKSTSGRCPRTGLTCGSASSCLGGDDGSTICHQFINQGGAYKQCEPF